MPFSHSTGGHRFVFTGENEKTDSSSHADPTTLFFQGGLLCQDKMSHKLERVKWTQKATIAVMNLEEKLEV